MSIISSSAVDRISHVQSAVQEFEKFALSADPLVLYPLIEKTVFSNHRVAIPCGDMQVCPFHRTVHDRAKCWIEIDPRGLMEVRCSLQPCLSYPNQPFMTQNAENIFPTDQINVLLRSLSLSNDTAYQRARNVVLRACARDHVRKDRNGYLFRKLRESVPYSYVKWMLIREYVEDVLRDNMNSLDDVDTCGKVTKLLTDSRSSMCDFMDAEQHMFGFRDGVLNSDSGAFTSIANVPPNMMVQRYFDRDFHPDDLKRDWNSTPAEPSPY